jgi:hypothetical protein
MTDEEVLKIAQGLTKGEWWTLEYNLDRHRSAYGVTFDPPLVRKRLLVLYARTNEVTVTPLGYRVWEWRELFR